MPLKIIVICLVCVLAFACGHDITGQNLCKNASFEKIVDNTTIVDWKTSAWVNTNEARLFTSSEKALEGARSGQIVNYTENHAYYLQTVSVKENAKYEITVYVKTENVNTSSKGAVLDVATVLTPSGDLRGDTDWTQLGLNLETSKGIHSIEILLSLGYFGSLNTGTAWFDQVSVVQVEKFNEQYPRAVIREREPVSEKSNLAMANPTVETKVKQTLDIFSIFAGIIIFLGTLLYLVFYIHKDQPLPEKSLSGNREPRETTETVYRNNKIETTENQEPAE